MLPTSAELTYFIELCSTLNLSRAAERIGISQPTLSVAMKKLEKAVGSSLFLRHKHGVTLTPAGKQLFLHARELLQYWEKTRSKALASHAEIQGHYTIGCHSTIAIYLVSTFLTSFLEKYPKLEIHLKHDISRKITEEVINLSLDVGIVVNPIHHPDLVIRKLFTDEVTFWVAKGNHRNQNVKLQDSIILCDPVLTQTQDLLKRSQKMGINSRRVLTMNSLEVIASLTAKGCGIGVLPSRVATAMYSKLLKRVPNAPIYHDQICLVYRHENRNIEAIRAIIDTIRSSVN